MSSQYNMKSIKSTIRSDNCFRVPCSPLTRSTDASMEKLNTQSSFDDDDEWQGVVGDAYKIGCWVYIGGTEELKVWQRPDSRGWWFYKYVRVQLV